jgi:hypothetical protein
MISAPEFSRQTDFTVAGTAFLESVGRDLHRLAASARDNGSGGADGKDALRQRVDHLPVKSQVCLSGRWSATPHVMMSRDAD